MSLGLLITIVLVITVIVVATKVREHSKKIAKLEQKSPASDLTATEAGTATPSETSQTSGRD